MFDSADILVDVHPVVRIFHHRRRIGVRRGEARIVPGRIDERVHRVRLAPRRTAAFRAGAGAPGRVTVKRVAGNVERYIVGQPDRQVFLLLGHHAAVGAMDDRNRAAPIALTGNPPVAQAVIRHAAANALRLAETDRGIDGLFAALQFGASKAADIVNTFRLQRHIGLGQWCFGRAFSDVDRLDRQTILGGELEIALVMRRATEDRPSAVVHQDEVGDIDRQFPVFVKRMAHAHAGIHALLLGLFQCLFRGTDAAAFGHELGYLRIVPLQMLGQRMIGADRRKACAQKRVGARGIDLQPVEPVRRVNCAKCKLEAARLADPVGLH